MGRLRVPALGALCARRDRIVETKQGTLRFQHSAGGRLQRFGSSGHFPMLDESEGFWQTVLEFLEPANVGFARTEGA